MIDYKKNLVIVILSINSLVAFAQVNFKIVTKEFDFNNLDNIPFFFAKFKKNIKQYSNSLDSNPLPLFYKVTGVIDDSICTFSLCSIPIKKVLVYEDQNTQIIYLLIKNNNDFVHKITNRLSNLPHIVSSTGNDEIEEFISSYCFMKEKYDIWISTGISHFTGLNNEEDILITLIVGKVPSKATLVNN
jgi:hypothetical protein